MFSIDIKTLKLGAIAVDGGMGTVLTSPGEVREDTVKLTPSDDVVNAFKAIGKSFPVITITEKGTIAIEYDILTFDVQVILDLCGGTIVPDADEDDFWHSPIGNAPIIEKSHELVDAQGGIWQLPRVQISGNLLGTFSKTDPNVVRVKGMVLQPTKAGIGAMAYGTKAA